MGAINRNNLFELGASPLPKQPYEPTGNFITEHTPRDAEWMRKFRHIQETREHFHEPCVSAEPMGAADYKVGGARENDPQLFFEYFAGAACYGGAYFHSERLLQANVPPIGSIENQCFEAVMDAWQHVPIDFLQGEFRYFFDTENFPVPALKFYGVELGSKGIATLTRPVKQDTKPSDLHVIDGWRATSVYRNCIVTLERT
jgi:hypothetical protein